MSYRDKKVGTGWNDAVREKGQTYAGLRSSRVPSPLPPPSRLLGLDVLALVALLADGVAVIVPPLLPLVLFLRLVCSCWLVWPLWGNIFRFPGPQPPVDWGCSVTDMTVPTSGQGSKWARSLPST